MTLNVPIHVYEQKTTLYSPIKGPAIVSQGRFNNGGHSGFGNQFAIDILGLTPNYAAMLRDGESNADYAGWGKEVLASADGEVVYARNDVPDNPPNVDPGSVFSKEHDPIDATAGNAVIIGHGNSEFSVVMHMQKGSVRVKKGDKVKRGDVIGLLGNSGDSFGPHLHFQLQDGPELFKYTSLPFEFADLKGRKFARGEYFSAN
ncbi:MAG: M23 family metallopeptidase [Chloracidobacterium sp.]|nr:M23 family metallopeptidase [Chloracidobacterium sp.]